MRLYIIVNRYSLAIQAGIQAMHVIPELYEKYSHHATHHRDVLRDWAINHKTVMVLRSHGGDQSIHAIHNELMAASPGLPFAIFYEPELMWSATAVGIVVPTDYYEVPLEEQPSPMLVELHGILDKYPFAH